MAQPETTKQWEKNVGGSAPGSQQLAPNTYASETALTSPEADVVTKGGSQLQQNESASDSTSPAFPQTVTTAPPPETSPNPRSCVTCRRRKVRCNKHHPCSNCIKAKIECVYPSPGRAPRKSKKPRDTELLARLRTLENIVKNLGGPDAINGNPSSLPLKKTTLHQNSAIEQPENYANTSDAMQQDATIKSEAPDTSEIEENMGKLMVEEGGSQYVSHRFWTSFGKTVDDLKSILDPLSSDDENDTVEESAFDESYGVNHDGFLFGFSSLTQSLRDFHPPPNQVDILWETYIQNIAPMVPIFHTPSLKPALYHGTKNLDSLDKNTEVMMLTIYYTSAASMSAAECLTHLGEPRDLVLGRYRFAVEQALGRAKILHSRSFTLLQGLVLFLLCVRQHDDTRYVWSMISIAYRIAQGLGLQRDGTHFNLSPFETEMRRRLWWHICILDFRASEDYGCDPFIYESSYDTRMPLNINDDDISPDSVDFPEEKEGCVETSFFLIRCEIVVVNKRLSFIPPSSSCRLQVSRYSVAEREGLIDKLSSNLETRFVRHCDMTIPIHWVCATVSRLVIAKLWLMIHQPMVQKSQRNPIAKETHDRLLMTSVEILEFSRLLETNVNTAKWGWLFRTHMQWHAVAFLLSELCVRPLCPGVDRAWRAINSVYEAWNMHSEKKNGMLWPAIRKLMARAVKFREKQLHQLTLQRGKQDLDIPGSCAASPSTDPSSTYLTSSSPPQYLQEPTSYSNLSSDMHVDNTTLNRNYNFTTIPQLGTTLESQWADPAAITQVDTSILSSASPSWSDWDQLVREFQLDVAQGGQANTSALTGEVVIPDWFE
ncbi:hypothetical protein H109_01567 [Trichophyton interdigitale MR816]|uniref:C6 finger domain transcription factor nscR n=1 Tax=Trichophyton interdigitale (strain MR816) TaxID=1215338 RepID=A0A059JG48_TRIIM|nr:hypothetical protein H101_06954 [Trichophyton interdigitale H6]KDB26638.1 hypothetical protein H109_01567 [Trichophyton interdigitale MR816]